MAREHLVIPLLMFLCSNTIYHTPESCLLYYNLLTDVKKTLTSSKLRGNTTRLKHKKYMGNVLLNYSLTAVDPREWKDGLI